MLGVLLVATGCSDEPKDVEETIAEPSVSPSPSPSPSPTFQPVQGSVEVTTLVSSHPERLGFPEDPAPDPAAVESSAAAVSDALDRYLDAAQRGEPDLATLQAEWLETVDPATAELLRTGITNPDNPVLTTSYDITVQADPTPVVAAVVASIERVDGTVVDVELVFDVSGDQPRLQLIGDTEAI